MTCILRYQRLYHRIDDGMSRFRASSETVKLRRELQRYRAQCKGTAGEFLELFFRHKFEGAPIADTVNSLRTVLARSRLPAHVAFDALYLLARITLHSEPVTENESYRQRALDIARAHDWRPRVFQVRVNWAFAMIESSDLSNASQQIREAEIVLAQMTERELRTSEVIQARSRLLAHKAKMLLLPGEQSETPAGAAAVVPKAIQLYEEAIALVRERDHLRVNQQIEVCEYIEKCDERLKMPQEFDSALNKAEIILSEAQRSLDSHNCEYCRAYFGEVFSRLLFLKGKRIVGHRPSEAIAVWNRAVAVASESIAAFDLVGHVEARLPRQTIADIDVEKGRLRRKIFLSHSSKDKALVRQFKTTLEIFHYEPWLDEDSLRAGDRLEKGLLEAIQSSCAIVFFVTPNFRDENYLQTEVEYAIAEKRKRGDAFRVIALVLGDEKSSQPSVPGLLEPYVHKALANPLDALRYIVESLPFEPGVPTWRL